MEEMRHKILAEPCKVDPESYSSDLIVQNLNDAVDAICELQKAVRELQSDIESRLQAAYAKEVENGGKPEIEGWADWIRWHLQPWGWSRREEKSWTVAELREKYHGYHLDHFDRNPGSVSIPGFFDWLEEHGS